MLDVFSVRPLEGISVSPRIVTYNFEQSKTILYKDERVSQGNGTVKLKIPN